MKNLFKDQIKTRMRGIMMASFQWILIAVLLLMPQAGRSKDGYKEVLSAFRNPDHARWGEVPLWWWEGEKMTRERATEELEILAKKGVKSVCPIQRSPGRCDPQSFDSKWWDMLAHVHKECCRLGMTLWAYDQIGYGNYGWLEKAAAKVHDTGTAKIVFLTKQGKNGNPIQIKIPEGLLLGARAYPLENKKADDSKSIDVSNSVTNNILKWMPPKGKWKIAVSVAVPMQSFYLSEKATDTFLDMLYGKIERTLGKDAMGTSFKGVFQDEHPPTPRNIYTKELARRFEAKTGYEIGRAIPALHFDVGPRTPVFRTDFFDVYMELVEETYWKRVFEWTKKRNILTSHDNWGRRNLYNHSKGYIDYFRSQRWFSAPGYDDSGNRAITHRNYYDAKIASSIARLYKRPRVWNEAFHSSGWGKTTEQTLTWLSAGMAFGANLYDDHGLYYSTRASTWEHAAPDSHWRQPYWKYYKTLSDWVARTSLLMCEGVHVVDAAVHYPVVSLLAGEAPGERKHDYNLYMKLSRTIYDAGIDNDIIDDDSILNGKVQDGRLFISGNGYSALVFGPETTIRRTVLEKALTLVKSGGVVLFFEKFPTASTEDGRDDPKLKVLRNKLLIDGLKTKRISTTKKTTKSFKGNGLCGFIPKDRNELPKLISAHIDRDFVPLKGKVFMCHRRTAWGDIYLVQSTEKISKDINYKSIDMKARFRTKGVPEIWDAFNGKVLPVRNYTHENGHTVVQHRLEGPTAVFFVFRTDKKTKKGGIIADDLESVERPLSGEWDFSVIPTRDNRRGEFRWPPSDEFIGPEIRTFRYNEEKGHEGLADNWHLPKLNDKKWSNYKYSTGPQWLYVGPIEKDAVVTSKLIKASDTFTSGAKIKIGKQILKWQELSFSKSIGSSEAAPWGGHSRYPDGHIDKNFVYLSMGKKKVIKKGRKKGSKQEDRSLKERKLVFTRLHIKKAERLGLRVELRNATPRLWVNNIEQPFEGAVGNLPLNKEENTVLLDLPNGGYGRLYVQRTPPGVRSMEEAAKGILSPNMRAAKWIWFNDASACYVRKQFSLKDVPTLARVTISAFSGFRLFVNGKKIEEEIGPWANWRKPESFNITPYLRKGKNVVAVWGQLFMGIKLKRRTGAAEKAAKSKGIVLALAMRHSNGEEESIFTDNTWKGSVDEHEGWNNPGFDDSAWPAVKVRGKMGDAPWGLDVVKNIGNVTEPYRPLSIHLDSPYLECFEEVPEVIYDVKQENAPRIGWYRFEAPPGLKALTLPTQGKAKVWVDGKPAKVTKGKTVVKKPPRGVSTVAVRVEMKPGEYAGAAFSEPMAITLKGGVIKPGLWKKYALPTYSGIGVYTKKINITKADLACRTFLDLGQVLVAAEVFVNGKSAGVCLARPFKFELTKLLHAGENTIEVRIANTIAPHYKTIPSTHLGSTRSGLIGPVRLIKKSEKRKKE